ncbi:MAG: ABC-F family ATP-binding cassette domain-containing protein, partial [Caldimonas sp.]
RYDGTMIVISHDREFLDATTKVTVHIDEAKLTRYTGNYTAFEEMRAERLSQQQAGYQKQQERIAHLQRFIDRFKAKASKAKQAQSRVKALARMERLAPVLTSADFQFEFREPASLPNPMLAFSGVACGYIEPPVAEYGAAPPEGGDPAWGRPGAGVGARRIISDIDRSVLAGQRIGILGANGQGKSTLVKTIVGDLAPLAGEIVEGKGLTIGYFAQQELDVLSQGEGPLMHMVRLARDVGPTAREQELRDFLGSFRFVGEMVTQPVGTLSGGEKARLVLAMLVWQRPNLLLLDEPTNHLDLTTREALSMALNEFEGTVMLVSHDRALLREVCDEFWLVAGGIVKPFDGDLDDYQRWLLEQSRANAREQARSDKAKKQRRAEGTASQAPASAALAKGAANANGTSATSAAAAGKGSFTAKGTSVSKDAHAASSTSIAKGRPATTPAPASTPTNDRKAAGAVRQQRAEETRPLRKELNLVDNRLGVLFAERETIEAGFSDAALSPAVLAESGKRLKLIGDQIETLEARWLDLSTQIDALAGAPG